MKMFTDLKILAEVSAIHVRLNYCQENSFLKSCYTSEPTLQILQHISKDLGNFCVISKFSQRTLVVKH